MHSDFLNLLPALFYSKVEYATCAKSREKSENQQEHSKTKSTLQNHHGPYTSSNQRRTEKYKKLQAAQVFCLNVTKQDTRIL